MVALVAGSAVLAVWLHVRRSGKMPESGARIALHLAAALASTVVVPVVTRRAGTQHSPATALMTLFTLFLPMLVYNFLTWLWLLKLLQRHLRLG
jgi:uncharacterized membrane protein